MTRCPTSGVSDLLQAWQGGDQDAFDKLVPLVHDELRRLAHNYMRRERIGHTLQTTALVNEAFLRLFDARNIDWKDRAHFFAVSASMMRRILVDFARSRGYQKRGGNMKMVSLNEGLLMPPGSDPDLVQLDDALSALSEMDPRKAKVVELRFFGGLSVEESAEVLKVSPETIRRDWRLAKTWLYRELRDQK